VLHACRKLSPQRQRSQRNCLNNVWPQQGVNKQHRQHGRSVHGQGQALYDTDTMQSPAANLATGKKPCRAFSCWWDCAGASCMQACLTRCTIFLLQALQILTLQILTVKTCSTVRDARPAVCAHLRDAGGALPLISDRSKWVDHGHHITTSTTRGVQPTEFLQVQITNWRLGGVGWCRGGAGGIMEVKQCCWLGRVQRSGALARAPWNIGVCSVV
jgi:hypothetical protein